VFNHVLRAYGLSHQLDPLEHNIMFKLLGPVNIKIQPLFDPWSDRRLNMLWIYVAQTQTRVSDTTWTRARVSDTGTEYGKIQKQGYEDTISNIIIIIIYR